MKPDIPQENRCQDECEGCPYGGPKVGSKGNPESPFVLVGESPGRNEVRTGIPFSGPSGQVLHSYIPADSCWITNAMECSPKQSKKDIKGIAYAARNCSGRLLEQIHKHPRRLIVAMGNAALWSLTGDYSLKITQVRGRLIHSDLSELGILPVVHPAALLRGTGNFRQFKQDLQYAKHLGDGGDPRSYTPARYKRIKSATGTLRAIKHLLRRTRALTCDIETAGLNHREDRILSIGITDTNGLLGYCFRPEYLYILRPYFESKQIQWCWHNGKFDIKFLRVGGVEARVDDDTMLQSYCLDERKGVHGLEIVAGDVLASPDYKHMLDPYLANKDTSYEEVPGEVLDEYMAIDTCNTARINGVYRPLVNRDPALQRLYTETLIPASEMLARVESNGFWIDQDWLNDADDALKEELQQVTDQIHEICGHLVNPGSPLQMKVVLYNQFKLPNKYKGSTDKNALDKLANNPRTRHPIVLALMKYRKVAKAYGTYIKGLRRHIQSDGRVYCTYLLHGTVTGRLASREPNLQNIPRDYILRGIFCAAPGYEILEVDLSQAELRSLAALSGDPDMVALYKADGDIHDELAIHLFGVGYTKEQRVKCKNVNFGIMYGISKYGLQDQIGGTLTEAERMINGWASRFPVAWEFVQECRKAPIRNLVLTTCFGRKKRVGLVTRENIGFLRNESANFPHQSIASDITLHAAIRLEPRLRRLGVKIVNLVHDSIVTEIPAKDVFLKRRVAKMIAEELEQVPIDWGITAVPFKADAESGERWGSLDKYNEWKEAA